MKLPGASLKVSRGIWYNMTIMKVRAFIFAVVVVALFLGCSKKQDENFIVSVDGRKLMPSLLTKRVEMMLFLQRAARPKMSIQEVEKIKKQLEISYPQLFVANVLLEEFAATNGIAVAENVLTNYQAMALKHCRGFKSKDWNGLLSELGSQAGEFSDLVMTEARRAAVKDWLVAANPTNVTPEFAARKRLELKDFNRRIDATNACIFAHATNVWQKIVAGMDFGDAAAEYSTLPAEQADRGEWATLDWKQIKPDEELYRWAKKLETGEVSPPIEADGGIMIARIDSKDEEECKISRIFFKQAINVVEMNEEEIVQFVKKQHELNLFGKKMAELRAAAVIEYGPDVKNTSSKTKNKEK